MEKSIRVRILGREYGLFVEEDDEKMTAEVASYLDAKMRSFRDSHPDQQDVTTAVIAGLAVTEEMFIERARTNEEIDLIGTELDALSDQLDRALRA